MQLQAALPREALYWMSVPSLTITMWWPCMQSTIFAAAAGLAAEPFYCPHARLQSACKCISWIAEPADMPILAACIQGTYSASPFSHFFQVNSVFQLETSQCRGWLLMVVGICLMTGAGSESAQWQIIPCFCSAFMSSAQHWKL